jgi:hypothetical protein
MNRPDDPPDFNEIIAIAEDGFLFGIQRLKDFGFFID